MADAMRQRGIAVLVAILLMVSACGSSGETELVQGDDQTASVDNNAEPEPTATEVPPAATTEAEPSPEPTAAVEPTPAPVDPEEWAAQVNEALEAMRTDMFTVEIWWHIGIMEDLGNPDVESAVWRGTGEVFAAFAESLPEPPPDLAEETAALRTSIREVSDAYLLLADDFDGDETMHAAVPYHTDPGWGIYVDRHGEILNLPELACFELQAAVDKAGYGLIDCLPDEDREFTPEECALVERAFGQGPDQCGEEPATDDDPLTIQEGQSDLSPGDAYTFVDFAQPFRLTPTDSIAVTGTDREVELFSSASTDLEIRLWILAPDEIADPTTMIANSHRVESSIAVPGELGDWTAQLPLAVVDEGVSGFGTVEARWWRLEPPAERFAENAFESWGFAESDINQVHVFRRDTVFWQIPGPDGDLIVYTVAVFESPDAVAGDELFAFVERTLSTLEFL